MFFSPINVLERWIECINNRALDDILFLYAETATLVPTFSPDVIDTPEGLYEYFNSLIHKPDVSAGIHEDSVRSFPITPSIVNLSGLYYFGLSIGGAPTTLEARFTFLVNRLEPRPILHHHSSQVATIPGNE